MSGKPVLGYWKTRGLGHPIRFLLKYLEVEYEEKIYEFTGDSDRTKSMEQWNADKLKLKMDFPNLPYFFDGPLKLTESHAIFRHLCRTRKPELLGATLEIQAKVEMIIFFLVDWRELHFVPVLFQYTDERHKHYKETTEPVKLKYLSDFMGENKWLTGNELTVVDFFAYEFLYHLTVYDSKCMVNFPKLTAYMKRFEELPAIKTYMNSAEFFKAPCYSPMAKIKI